MTSTASKESPSLYAVEAIGQFGGSEFFSGLRKVGDDGAIGAPYAIRIDSTTESALLRSTAAHFARLRSVNIVSPHPELIGIIVGAGHPVQIFEVLAQHELKLFREIAATILYVEIDGNSAPNRSTTPVYENVIMYSPQNANSVQSRRWWQFWRRGS